MTECFACGANFEVIFENEHMPVNFCPHCGQETVDDIKVLTDLEDQDLFDEDES